MKVLSFFLILIALSRPTWADDSSFSPGSHPVQDASSDAEEQDFHDPFAKEGETSKARVSDPLEPMNRAFYKFNDKLYLWVLKPAATGYSKVAPEPFRLSIKRFFVNVRYPVRVVNNLLQGKFKGAGVETARFLVNSTLGIGGLFDPARDEWEWQPRPEDLDQTLGFYGLPTGIYFHWPLYGPSSVRGTVGTLGDSFLSLWNYIDGPAVMYGTRAYDTLNSTSLQLSDIESFRKATFDPYISLRDAYFENRRSLVNQ
jgi:phospholipid-binding lipoprotein MlaA